MGANKASSCSVVKSAEVELLLAAAGAASCAKAERPGAPSSKMVQSAASIPRRPRRNAVANHMLPKRTEAVGSDCMFFPRRRIWTLFLSLENGLISHKIVLLKSKFEVYSQAARGIPPPGKKAAAMAPAGSALPRLRYVPGGTLLTRHDKFDLSRRRTPG